MYVALYKLYVAQNKLHIALTLHCANITLIGSATLEHLNLVALLVREHSELKTAQSHVEHLSTALSEFAGESPVESGAWEVFYRVVTVHFSH